MLPATVILALLAAEAAPPAAPPKVPSLAAPGLSSVNLPPEEASFYSEHLAQQMLLQGIRVVTAAEIGTLLGFERQKQLLGCGDEAASCMAELGAALGVDGLLMGSVGRFGSSYQVNVKVIAANDGKALSAYSERVKSDGDLLDALTRAAKKMSAELGGKAPPVAARVASTPAQAEVSSGAPGVQRPVWPWIAGGVGIGLGAASVFNATRYAGTLRTGTEDGQPLLPARAMELRGTGRLFEFGGYALGAAGLGLMGYAVYRSVAAPPEETGAGVAQLTAGSDGRSAWLGVGGRF